MKGKKLAVFSLVLMILFGMLGISPVFSVLNVCPVSKYKMEGPAVNATWYEPTHAIGETFNIDVVAYTVVDLWAWSAAMRWNSSVLNCTGFTWGGFAAASGTTLPPITGTINNTIGNMTTAFGESSNAAAVNATSLKLITFTFKLVGFGNSTLIFNPGVSCKVTNKELQSFEAPTYFALESGWFAFMPAPNVAPVASFTWSPSVPTAGVHIVTFNASASYDPEGVGIKNMTFNFGTATAIPPNATLTSPPWTVNVNYTVAGTFTVTLTVWDKGKPPYEAQPDYAPKSATATATIKVVPPAPPSGVDVFTIKTWLGNTTMLRARGTGPEAPGSAFAPGENVTLRGYVYYEGLPVIAAQVGFQVKKPDGTIYTSRAASTNVAGNATISFRLPLMPMFGAYRVIATARVFETDFSDTLDFNVGWMITLNSVTITPDVVAKGGSVTITVNATNIDPYDAYPVVFTASLYDKFGIPIGFNYTATSLATGTAIITVGTIVIAADAWSGYPAVVEANAYTNLPELGGTAYCSPKTASFEIT